MRSVALEIARQCPVSAHLIWNGLIGWLVDGSPFGCAVSLGAWVFLAEAALRTLASHALRICLGRRFPSKPDATWDRSISEHSEPPESPVIRASAAAPRVHGHGPKPDSAPPFHLVTLAGGEKCPLTGSEAGSAAGDTDKFDREGTNRELQHWSRTPNNTRTQHTQHNVRHKAVVFPNVPLVPSRACPI